ncbi:MAG: aldo/keto reductase [Armatimonadota bacterium]|nr:aldo/keto reductase [Armatimonadota bacterium]MDR5697077.1 aldo/keto reductase [Armatimonadota bacterium]
MERRLLGRTGLSVPVIGMGTWKTFDVRDAEAEAICHEIAHEAVRAGANFFDSSPMYGEAERVLADAVRPMRDTVTVATKVWAETEAEGRRQIERALRWFGGRVDVYQVHNLVSTERHLSYLEDLHVRGQVRAIGVTHYTHAALAEIIRWMESGRVHCVQVPYNAADRAVEREVLPRAQQLGIGVIVMRPLGGGGLARRSPPVSELRRFEPFGVQTWAQVLLKWIASDARVHVVIPATSRPGRMTESAVAGDPPWFDEETRERISALASR